MESAGARRASGASRDPGVVCEKHLFKGELPEPLFQLACSHHLCAFPVNCNELCVWNTATDQPLFLSGHHYSISALSFGSKINPLLVCSASREHVIVWNLDECTEKVQEGFTPRGIVIGTLLGMVLHVRFSPDDEQVAVCAGNQIYMLSAKNEAILAELDGHLAPVTAAEFCTWEKSMLISVSEDRTFKVWDYSTSQLIYQSGIITAFPLLSLLIDEENKQIITGCAEGQLWIFSLISDHNYRCIAHIDLKKEQEKFCNKVWKSGKEIGEGQNNSKLCKTDNMRPEGSVETSLPILLIEHCDFFVCFHNEENTYSSLNTSYFWIGTSTGLLIINLANFELEAFLSYRDYSDLSIRIARTCALTRKAANQKVLCLITSMFEDIIAVLEVNLAALVRTQHSDFLPHENEKSLSVIARCPLLSNSPLCKGLKKNMKEPSSKTLGVKGIVKDKPVVFHNKIKSSGYTAAPRMTMFSPNTNLKKKEVSKWKTSCKCKNKEYPLESYPPIKYEKEVSVTCKPTPIFCIQYSGDGELLACGLADKTVLIFNSNLTDVHNVFSGHDGAVNSVGWSHDKKWLVSASEDRTLRIWSACNKESALVLGKENFRKNVRFAQFYFIDTFILLCCGAEFHLLSLHLDTTKDDIKRYKQRSVCKLVQKFPMMSTMEITSLSAVNEFYSCKFNFNTENCTDIVLTAGSNRALEVFDLNAGCSTAVIQEAHVRSVHQICQNKGSSFSTQQPEAYNLFMTTAAGDGIKLWDLRTLRCERRFEGHSSRCYPCGIAVSPCGRFIASGSDDKYAYIYEMRSSTFLHKLGRHTESVINVCFSPSSPQYLQIPASPIEYHSHRKVDVGRDCCRSSSPTPLLNLGYLQQVVQIHVQSAFGYLPEWRLHNLSGQMDSNLTARWPSIGCNHGNFFITVTHIKSGSPQPPWMANSNCSYPDTCQPVELWLWYSENNDSLRERRLVTSHKQVAKYSLQNCSFLLSLFSGSSSSCSQSFSVVQSVTFIAKIRAKDQEKKETTHSDFILVNHLRSVFQRTSWVLIVGCILSCFSRLGPL